MIKHIVFLKLREPGSALDLKKAIEGLRGQIPGLMAIKAGINFSPEDRACDLALIADLHTRADLSVYATHPAHVAVLDKIKKVAEYSKVVDYEYD
ncbi:MAG: Dabb family protein [Helicobacteraceae bacterium]